VDQLRAKNAPLIKVSAEELSFQGRPLAAPPVVRDVFDMLGQPDRILPGTPPGPPGHRNNEAYMYDDLGMYWLRQHDSERILSLSVVFAQSNGPISVPFMPSSPFCGAILLPGLTVTSRTRDVELRNALRNPATQAIANIAGAYIGPFHISFLTAVNSQAAATTGNLASVSIGLRHWSKPTAPPGGMASEPPPSMA